MIITAEVLKKTGLTTHKFRRLVKELSLSPIKKRGEVSFRWTPEQVELLTEIGKTFFNEPKEVKELDIIEYYVNNRSNVHRTANKFKLNYYTVYRMVKKYERIKFVEVKSKL